MSPEIVVSVVEELKGNYPVKLICKVLKVPVSTYYRWRNKDFHQENELEVMIGNICKKEKLLYGYRKVTAVVRRQLNRPVNHKLVQKIMQKNQWQCKSKPKKAVRKGKEHAVMPNILNRDFQADRPLQKLTTDITYLTFGPKVLYLSSIMDLYNGEIIAYTISDTQNTSLVLDTLNQLGNQLEDCLLHSDQGSVYTSAAYYNECKNKGITRSMSRKGTPADNAPIEWFHSILKSEAFYISNEHYGSSEIIIQIVKDFINQYNNNRIQAKLGYLSPVAYRNQAA